MGLAIAVLAGVVISGWLLELPVLVRVLPDAPPMRFNTAAMLLLVGVSFVALASGRTLLVRCLAIVIALFAAATVSQYPLQIDLGIDNLFLRDTSGFGPNPSGRMAVNTALCFLFLSGSLVSLSLPRYCRWQPFWECLCGSVVCGVGTVAAFGYLAGIDAAYGWYGSAGMALHTALAFALSGGTLIILVLTAPQVWSAGWPSWLPVPASIALGIMSFVVWQALRLEDQKEVRLGLALRARALANQIDARLKERVAALERMANRWATSGPPAVEHWRADSSLYLKHYPDFQIITWVSPDGKIRWLVPYQGNELVQSLDVTAEQTRRRCFELARDQRSTVITPVIDLVQGGKGIAVLCPIYVGDDFQGCIAAAFKLNVIVDKLAQADLAGGYQIAALDGSQQVYPVAAEAILTKETGEALASFGGLQLRVQVNRLAGAASSSHLPEIVLVVGLAFAVLVGLLIYYGQTARSRLSATAKAIAALHASEQKFRAIFDQTFQFIGLLSPAGVVLEANRSALMFAGISETDVLGKPFWETPWWTHSAEEQMRLREAIGRAAKGEMIRMEVTHPDSSGCTHYVDFSLKPVLDEWGQVTLLIPEGRDVTDRKHVEQELARSALLDKLTGLPNRGLLLDRLQQRILRAQRAGKHNYAIMFLDFDGFKLINDSLGHDAGDALLQEISKRLQESVRSVDSVSCNASGNVTARLGGDEFVVLLDELNSPGDLLLVAERLLSVFGKPYQLGKQEVVSTASIGIVAGDPKYERAEDVLRNADTAMYEAKRGGRARYVVFDDSMLKRVQRRLQRDVDLRKAADQGQLALVYHPMLSLQSGEIKSAEALLRWQHPTDGELQPDEFIPIAEESDLILAVGEWVLTQACRQMANWIRTLGALAPATISVNLSHRHLVAPELLDRLRSIFKETELDPCRLQLEISEGSLGKNQAACALRMHEIRQLGVQLAIDDFGTGSLSFAAVHRFPVDVLKADGCLCSNIEDSKDAAALFHALAVLVKNLGVCLVAEGVETMAQAMTLQELGCEHAQGFVFADPMRADEFEEFVMRSGGTDQETAGAMAFTNRWADRLALQPLAR